MRWFPHASHSAQDTVSVQNKASSIGKHHGRGVALGSQLKCITVSPEARYRQGMTRNFGDKEKLLYIYTRKSESIVDLLSFLLPGPQISPWFQVSSNNPSELSSGSGPWAG